MPAHRARRSFAALLIVFAAGAGPADRAGDPLPAGAVARLGTVRWRNGAGLFPIAFAPDGKTLATAGGSPWVQQGVQSADSTIRLWDVAAGKELRQFNGHQGVVTALAFSPDGTTLAASAPPDNGVRLWDVSGGESRKLEFPRNVGPLTAFAFSPDGKTLALAGGEQPLIQLRDVASGKDVGVFGEQPAAVESVAYSPDGTSLAVKSGGLVRLWDVAGRRLIRKFRPRTYYAKQSRLGFGERRLGGGAPVLFTPDGKTLIAEGADNTLHVWDVATGKEVRQLLHRAPVVSAALSPDGRRLASGCEDNAVRVWDLATGKEVLHREGHFGGYMGVAFSPDGKLLASAGGDHTVHLWDAATGKQLNRDEGHRGEVIGGAFLAGGKVVATAGRDNTVRFWDAATGEELRHFENRRDLIDHVAFSPDAKTLVTGGWDDDVVHVWDAATGKHLRELPRPPLGFQVSSEGEQARLHGLRLTPDGKSLAALSPQGSVQLWPAGGGEARPIGGDPHPVRAFAFAPDGKVAALALGDNTLRLWDLSNGKELRRCEVQPEDQFTFAVLFSPDGKTLASLHADNVVRFWDVGSGRPLHRFQHGGEALLYMAGSAAFSPDSRSFATSGSGDRVVRLWEVATGRERRSFAGHRGPVAFVAFSPDGRRLASGGWDTTALVWDVAGLRAGSGPAEMSVKNLEELWADLADADAAKAFRAVGRLARAADQAVACLQQRLRPVAAVDQQVVVRLIAELDSDQFGVRQRASQELEQLGPLAEPELRKAFAGGASLEVRRRIGQLLEKRYGAAPPADRLRTGRALEALELIGTPAAKQLLAALAGGAAQADLTRDAKAALERLARRSAD